MKIILWSIFLLLLVAFQGSMSNPVEAGGIRPDFILITVYFLGIFKGEIKGGFIGAVLGFFLDITSAGPVYSNIFSKCFMGYLAGVIGRWVHNPGYILHMGLIFLVSLIQGFIIFLIFIFLGTERFPEDILYIVIPQAVFDGITGGVIFSIITFITKKGPRIRGVEGSSGI